MKVLPNATFTQDTWTLKVSNSTLPSGESFAQGDLFPRHVRAGDLTFLESVVLRAFLRDTAEDGVSIIEKRDKSYGYIRIRARIRPAFYGVREICGFIQHGSIITMWPTKTVGKAYKTKNGEKTKK